MQRTGKTITISGTLAVALAAFASAGWAAETSAPTGGPDRETVYQVSLLQGLTLGDYHGSVSVGTLKSKGDTGIGTFNTLNGELIMVDGVVYRAAGDGRVSVVPDQETVPFADVTFFEADEKRSLKAVENFAALRTLLDERVRELGANRFYMIRLDGLFREMHVRSERAQSEPYRPLAAVMDTDQTLFDYKDIRGTVVGLYCPVYMDHLNVPGWHLHFVSEDKAKGGHVLDLSIDEIELSWDYTGGFAMILPENPMFRNFDFRADQTKDIQKVEQGK